MLPTFVKPFLWYVDDKKIDQQKDKRRIILNVLNLGTKKSTDWLFKTYSKKEIKKVVTEYGAKGELSPKSLNYWTLVLKIDKDRLKTSRF